MKRLITITLCLILVLAMAVPALATDVPEATEEEVMVDESFGIVYYAVPDGYLAESYEVYMDPQLATAVVPEATASASAMPTWIALILVIFIGTALFLITIALPVSLIVLIIVLIIRTVKKKTVVTQAQTAEAPEEKQE